MRYILLSDIHGNLQALETVIRSCSKKKYDKVICVGDTVGYGANPNECIEKISHLADVNILGNHDAAVTGKADYSNFNEWARDAVDWTREHLDSGGFKYLSRLELVYACENFEMAHGTLHSPEDFIYMMGGRDAMKTFEIMNGKVCFVGHSHIPGAFILRENGLSESRVRKIKIEEGARYIINVGSVGQPRDGDPRACYCIYDTEEAEVEFFRLEYDIMEAEKRIRKAGLPVFLAARLARGR